MHCHSLIYIKSLKMFDSIITTKINLIFCYASYGIQKVCVTGREGGM